EIIVFNAASSADPDGQVANFLWDFGDGATASVGQATTSHIYIATGAYSVFLRVIDNLQATSSPATTSITVLAPPVAPPSETPSFSVVINEIAWAGTRASANDEWLELFNNTGAGINLAGWHLASQDGSPDIAFPTSTIPANGFYLLERTNDTTINDIPADYVYTGALNNSGEKLELKDSAGQLIDVVDFSTGWPNGNNTTKQTMERIQPNASSSLENWASNNTIAKNGLDADDNKIYGTPKAQNSVSRTQTNIVSGDFDFAQFDTIAITYLGSPYIAHDTITVPQNKTLVIEPGASLKFFMPAAYGPGDGAYLNIGGSLKAIGQAGKEITFTSTGDFWPGIYFSPTSRGSELNYVKIEKARNWEMNVFSAVKAENSDLIFRNSEIIISSNKFGLYLKNSSSTIEASSFSGFGDNGGAGVCVREGRAIIRGTSFTDNNYGILFESYEGYLQNPDIVFSNNTFTHNKAPVYIGWPGFPAFVGNTFPEPYQDSQNNIIDGPVFGGGSITQDALLQSDSPFIAGGLVVSGATLNIATSTKIKFKYTADPLAMPFVRVMAGAKLDAQSEIGQPIVFTSAHENPQPGEWYGLWFEQGSQGVLKNVKIDYAGFSAWDWQKQPLKIDAGANVLQENVDIDPTKNIVL
ncbi:MAG: PKD domain-containing protein, partial [Patescibacteria group bacterium]